MRTFHPTCNPGACAALLACAAVATAAMASGPAYGAPGDTTLVSVTPTGKATYNALRTTISADGGRVVFMAETKGEALVLEPVAPDWQAYARDTVGPRTWRVGVGSGGEAANSAVEWPMISADGRFAVFQSKATNLVAGVEDGRLHVFVQDLDTGLTEVVSLSSQEALSNGDSYGAALSADGRFIAFASRGTNLVPNDTNAEADVFLRDRLLGTTARVSVSSSEGQGNGESYWGTSVSQDGRYVGFTSKASNLVAGDTNGTTDGFVRDRTLGLTERISVGPNGEQTSYGNVYESSVVLNATGRYVLFETPARLTADDLDDNSDVYLRDRELATTELISGPYPVSPRTSYATTPSISDDGRYVAFCTMEEFDPRDTFGRDVYVKDRLNGVLAQASVTSAGELAYGDTGDAMISGDGRYVAFSDWSIELLTAEQRLLNAESNVFLHERKPVVVRYTLWPVSLDFGARAIGSSTRKTFWLRNRSRFNLPLTTVKLVGADRGMFVVWHRCGPLLAVGEGCGLNVVFKPTGIGEKAATLYVEIANSVRTQPITGVAVR